MASVQLPGHQPVVTDSCEPGNVQHQRGVQRARLGRLALRRRRALVTQHAAAGHPPQLGALPRLLHREDNKGQQGSEMNSPLKMQDNGRDKTAHALFISTLKTVPSFSG